MFTQTLKALEGSIAKWDLIAQGIGTNEGVANCPLCQLFHIKGKHCMGCPIEYEVKEWGCRKTPYSGISLAICMTLPRWINDCKCSSNSTDVTLDIESTLNEIENEVEFLISLLPDDHELRKL